MPTVCSMPVKCANDCNRFGACDSVNFTVNISQNSFFDRLAPILRQLDDADVFSMNALAPIGNFKLNAFQVSHFSNRQFWPLVLRHLTFRCENA